MRINFRSKYNTEFSDVFEGLTFMTTLRLVFDGALVGLVAGIFASSFRWCLEYLAEVRNRIIAIDDVLVMGIWFISLALMGYIVHKMLEFGPLSGGSGIPQIEGEMRGIFYMNAWRTLIAKYIGGALTSLGGFSVGREGPSIQVGGAVGKIISKIFKRSLREERILISAGAAAGLTSAFTAPISGAVFIFEEVHKTFFPLLFIPTFTAAMVANYIANLWFGSSPVLGFTVIRAVPISYSGHLVLMGVFVGVVAVAFNRALLYFKQWHERILLPRSIKMMLTFVAVGMVGYWSIDLIGGGNNLVSEIAHSPTRGTILFLSFILVGKILFTAFCYGSGAQGGIFLPILVIGAAAGALFFNTLQMFSLVNSIYLPNFILAALGGIMAASIRVPLLAILLVLEMTQSFANTYALGVVSLTAYLTAEFMKEQPIYDSLLALMTPRREMSGDAQTLFQARISVVSPYIGKTMPEIQKTLPKDINIISLERDEKNILPTSEDILVEEQDILYISCARNDLSKAKKLFE